MTLDATIAFRSLRNRLGTLIMDLGMGLQNTADDDPVVPQILEAARHIREAQKILSGIIAKANESET